MLGNHFLLLLETLSFLGVSYAHQDNAAIHRLVVSTSDLYESMIRTSNHCKFTKQHAFEGQVLSRKGL